jgi:hypothetical protein
MKHTSMSVNTCGIPAGMLAARFELTLTPLLRVACCGPLMSAPLSVEDAENLAMVLKAAGLPLSRGLGIGSFLAG